MRSLYIGVATALAVLGAGCALLPSACLKRQVRREAWTVTGSIPAGHSVDRVVEYAVEGSQNDLSIRWTGQGTVGGPRLVVFATRVECMTAQAAASRSGVCGRIGSAGGSMAKPGEFVQQSLTIVHGRGNPEVLGSPARYRLWIVGDAQQTTSYTITSASFYGPDC